MFFSFIDCWLYVVGVEIIRRLFQWLCHLWKWSKKNEDWTHFDPAEFLVFFQFPNERLGLFVIVSLLPVLVAKAFIKYFQQSDMIISREMNINEMVAIAIVVVIYIVMCEFGLFLSEANKLKINNAGCLAQGFYTHLKKNGLKKEKIKETFDTYNAESQKCKLFKIGDSKPFILFPDLSCHYYTDIHEKFGEKPYLGVLGGLVDYENFLEKKKNQKEILKTPDSVTYSYKDFGTERESHYQILVMKENVWDAINNKELDMEYFYFVCDNRPLLAIQKWRLDDKPSETEFKRHLESYENRLVELLEKDAELRNSCNIIRSSRFKGAPYLKGNFRCHNGLERSQ